VPIYDLPSFARHLDSKHVSWRWYTHDVATLRFSDGNYALVTVPPFVWNGFKGIAAPYSVVANCATIPHDPAEIVRLDPFSPKIPYDWSLRNG